VKKRVCGSFAEPHGAHALSRSRVATKRLRRAETGQAMGVTERRSLLAASIAPDPPEPSAGAANGKSEPKEQKHAPPRSFDVPSGLNRTKGRHRSPSGGAAAYERSTPSSASKNWGCLWWPERGKGPRAENDWKQKRPGGNPGVGDRYRGRPVLGRTAPPCRMAKAKPPYRGISMDGILESIPTIAPYMNSTPADSNAMEAEAETAAKNP